MSETADENNVAAAMTHNGGHQFYEGVNGREDSSANSSIADKPFFELYVKASGIDAKRIGACLFCQEFWMELYALYELSVIRMEVKTVNVNSEAFKKHFTGAQPPILVDPEKNITYSDNRDLEGCIFHLAKDANVPLFEKDTRVEKSIESLYRNFKVFLKSKTDHDRQHSAQQRNGTANAQPLSASVQPSFNKLAEQLAAIDKLLQERGSRYLLGSAMTEYDCELMPRLHHIRVVGEQLCGFDIPHDLLHLWNYVFTAYRTAAFIESCPADQDIIYHYKEQLNLQHRGRESLQVPKKSHSLPENVLAAIQKIGLDKKFD